MSVATIDPKHNVTGNRQAYYDKITKQDMAPLWEVLRNIVTKEPKTKSARRRSGSYKDVKALMLEAGDVITAEEAERRVLVLENPALRGQSRITNRCSPACSSSCRARSPPPHRTSASAIRFVLDGEGAYTAVDGEKTIMAPRRLRPDAELDRRTITATPSRSR